MQNSATPSFCLQGEIPPGSKGYGGHCDQFGSQCRSECGPCSCLPAPSCNTSWGCAMSSA